MGTLIGLFIKLFKYFLIFIVYYFSFCGAVLLPLLLILVIKPDLLNLVFPNAKAATPEELQKVILIALVPIFLWIGEAMKKEFWKNFKNSFLIVGLISVVSFFIINQFKTIDIRFQYLGTGVFFIYMLFMIIKKIISNKKQKSTTVFEKKNSREAKGFVFKTKSGTIYLDNPQRGIYVQGGAGSGKSVNVFEPIINQMAQQNYSGILYDFKSPELINKVRASYYNAENVSFKIIDFKDAHNSNRVNPIHPKYLTKSIVAIEYAQALVNNMITESIKQEDFWSRNTKMIIAGTIWFLKEKHSNYCTLPHVISLLLHTDIYQLLEKITEDYEAGGMVTTLKSAMDRKAENQVAGVLSSVQNALSTLNNKEVFWLLSDNDFDLELNNLDEPTFLAIGNDSSLPNTYSPLISLIISVALRQMNTPNKGKSIVLLDEAPTIYVPNLEQVPATGRSNGISTVLGVQDFSQLIEKYGKEKAEIIISNLGNQFFGRTTNHNTANMIKNIFSKEDRVFETSNVGTGSSGEFIHLNTNKNKGRSESIQERDRVKVSDLINLEPGEFYGIIAEGTPREFLKTKFIQQEIDSELNNNSGITEEMMKDNYFKIIEEAKSIL